MQLNCLIVGEQTLPVQCADLLLARGHRVVGVITSDRGFQDWAGQRNIPWIDAKGDVVAFGRSLDFDCLFSIVNGRILPDELLGCARRYAINFHDGPLPEFPGFNVTNWALLQGETMHAITWHGISSRIDGGDIYKRVPVEIGPEETAFTLNAKCYEAALGSFGALVDELASGTAKPIPQDFSRRTYISRYRRPAGACMLDFANSAETLARTVRALDFGPYPNPLGVPKFWDGHQWVLIAGLSTAEPSGKPPGTIVAAGPDTVRIATASQDVILTQPRRMDGTPWSANAGWRLPALDAGVIGKVTELHQTASRHEPYWTAALASASPLTLGRDLEHLPAAPEYRSIPVPVVGLDAETMVAAFLAHLVRAEGLTRFDVAFQDARSASAYSVLPGTFAPAVPLRVDTELDRSHEQFRKDIAAAISELSAHETFLMDLFARYPELRGKPAAERTLRYAVGVRLLDSEPAAWLPMPGRLLTLNLSGGRCELVYDSAVISEVEAEARRDRLAAVFQAIARNAGLTLAELPVMAESERQRLIQDWNNTEAAFENACIHHLFEKQAATRPGATAVAFEDREICYADLNARANQLAAHLRALGAGPEQVVAVYMDRSIELVVALLGILKSGAAYLPIDASLPKGRRDFMLEQAGVRLVVTEERLAADVAGEGRDLVLIDAHWPEISRHAGTNLDSGATPDNLAYVIYTSGSTGQPKGVAITHRNVANFFCGMDERIGGGEPGVWLAVTSISFDISVLELFWTLARGFKIVLAADAHRALVNRQVAPGRSSRPLEFSLFYFATAQDQEAREKYRLLLEGARYADEHGFHAVWTPERHFHSFGGPYPNPSVTSAAVAAITRRVQIRAGSVVLPLHHPARVAEEWSVVDNLSGGRVGISFASGWHARDFIFAPENYSAAKDVMFRNIEQVRRLWKGESLLFPDGKGVPTPISIFPRPVQSDLPVWVTAAGNPETFRMAGERGYNLLTHLLGQRIEDLAEKIRIYREALRAAGFAPESGRVTLMLHTFVGETTEQARECVRDPLKRYLNSSLDLIRNAPWSFPAFTHKPGLEDVKSANLNALSAEDLDSILEYAFERYFETSGLFGTVEQCTAIAERLRQIGVDEIACLIDFGVDTELALKNLDLLNQVRQNSQKAVHADYSLPAQMAAHGVTHLQCTPSLAKMLVASADARAELRNLKKLMVGGESLPAALAKQLVNAVGGEVHNMYGPTETTIWSTTAPVRGEAVTIGRPIANTSIYILDAAMQPVPTGLAGDLYIGGEGVARGYLHRPDLTAERFLPDPFRPGQRVYKTGDLARYGWDGSIEFLGRSDFQVKVRGFRIELGEIETVLNRYPGVRDSVVVARQQDSEAVLTAYYIPDATVSAGAEELRAWLRQQLPDYMVPALYVAMQAFPLTHNGKIDRKALPEPPQAVREIAETLRPAGELEQLIASLWQKALNRSDFSAEDNFFDLGGHSILVVQINTQLRQALGRDISLVDMFRFPSIRSLAKYLSAGRAENGLEESSRRAQLRQSLAASRRAVRGSVPVSNPRTL